MKLTTELGLVLIVVGSLFLVGKYVPFIGHLPGDIYVQGRNYRLFFPFTTGVLFSVIASIILRLFGVR